ncbi:cysteate racemase [Microbacterium halophytorum]|uniref:aspartate/glutamate racemase family protein n=1 Tax=Microbacterium halophytorum TaxID=2067568 RepID=UPI00131A2340|nr:amino acid racemase [Microbacterium halophytorum]
MTGTTIGILGGMGPAASVHFQKRLVDLTPAESDADHPPTVMWSDPQLPDRVAALRGSGASPVPGLRRGAEIIRSAGADIVAVPCNTVHPFLDDALGAGGYVDMIGEAARIVASHGITRAAVLATAATLEDGMYERALAAHGVEATHPDDQQAVLDIIAAVKAGGDVEALRARLFAVITHALAGASDGVLVACTELSVLMADAPMPDVVDALDELARETLRRAGIDPA